MSWAIAERGDLCLAVRVLTLDNITADEAGMCLFKLLDELELYKDPSMGKGFIWVDDEFALKDQLAIKLNEIVGDVYPAAAGERAISHRDWGVVVGLAKQLLPVLRKNGLGLS